MTDLEELLQMAGKIRHAVYIPYGETSDPQRLDDERFTQLAEKVFGHMQFPTVAPQGQAFPLGRVSSMQSH